MSRHDPILIQNEDILPNIASGPVSQAIDDILPNMASGPVSQVVQEPPQIDAMDLEAAPNTPQGIAPSGATLFGNIHAYKPEKANKQHRNVAYITTIQLIGTTH